jgi:hypothetical protein
MEIKVDDAVKEFIIREGMDYRLSTTCNGPALVSTIIKPAKASDISIPIGDFKLYVSKVQMRYVSRITTDMIYDPEKIFACSALRSLRDI